MKMINIVSVAAEMCSFPELLQYPRTIWLLLWILFLFFSIHFYSYEYRNSFETKIHGSHWTVL